MTTLQRIIDAIGNERQRQKISKKAPETPKTGFSMFRNPVKA
jgi:hypothetical protein